MSGACGHHHDLIGTVQDRKTEQAYRRVLWCALGLNLAMGILEVGAGHTSGSIALFADALDFFGDSANYAISLAVLGAALVHRARVALLKGLSMAVFGLAILTGALLRALSGQPPEAPVMGVVGLLALGVNVGVALLLVRHRGGDANRRAVWLCSRNDAIGNVAVLGAALGVHLSASRWPDLAVAAGMAGLALWSAIVVIRHALDELRSATVQSLKKA